MENPKVYNQQKCGLKWTMLCFYQKAAGRKKKETEVQINLPIDQFYWHDII